MLLYSFGTQQIVLLLINKSGNMFQLIEPLSGQFINNTESTFSRCEHCRVPQRAHLLNLPSVWFENWPDEG